MILFRVAFVCGLGVWVAILASGCGLNMQAHYKQLRPYLLSRDFDSATEFLEESKRTVYRTEKNRVVFYMNQGMVLHLAGDHQASNEALEKAKQASDDLWTESVSEHVGAFLSTDNALSYAGEDFERVLICFFKALNYIALGQFGSARIEARQITSQLDLYNQRYEEQGDATAYQDDAFARWLSGKLRETEGGFSAFNDAWIEYKKAIALYEKEYEPLYGTSLPDFVVRDALRVLQAMGADFKGEYRQLRKRYPRIDFVEEAQRREQGEVVFIHLGGEAPVKADDFYTLYLDSGPMRVAVPRYVRQRSAGMSARVHLPDGGFKETQLVEDIAAIAIRNLDDNMPRIAMKAFLRAGFKRGMAHVGSEVGREMQQSGDHSSGAGVELAAELWKVYNFLGEEADKRSWVTLPSRIGANSFFIAPGDYSFRMDVLGSHGQVVESAQLPAKVARGQTTFVVYRTFR